jgi:3-oxoacyl-[acyl-carrier protein] reductase
MAIIEFCSLQGRVAVVTGSARGIGKAIAEKLALLGADIVIADMMDDLANQTAEELSQQTQRKTLATKVNVAEPASVNRMVEQTLEQFGRVDILVNNAGITRDMLILRMEEADWDAVINVNLKGVLIVRRLS